MEDDTKGSETGSIIETEPSPPRPLTWRDLGWILAYLAERLWTLVLRKIAIFIFGASLFFMPGFMLDSFAEGLSREGPFFPFNVLFTSAWTAAVGVYLMIAGHRLHMIQNRIIDVGHKVEKSGIHDWYKESIAEIKRAFVHFEKLYVWLWILGISFTLAGSNFLEHLWTPENY